jgi:hypothetical protein
VGWRRESDQGVGDAGGERGLQGALHPLAAAFHEGLSIRFLCFS